MDFQLKNGSKKLPRTSHIIIDIDTKDFLELFDSEVIQSINKIRFNIDEIKNLEKATIRADADADTTRFRRSLRSGFEFVETRFGVGFDLSDLGSVMMP